KWMTKCSVERVRNLRAGSNRLAAESLDASVSSTAIAVTMQVARLEARTPSVPWRLAGDVLQEREVGDRQDVDACQVAARHRRVGLAPEADVGRLLGDDPLDVGVERAAPR